MNKTITKEEITALLHAVDGIFKSMYLMDNSVIQLLGTNQEQFQHLTEIRMYLYFGWEAYAFGDVNLLVPDKDKKMYSMFKAKAYDQNHNRIPERDWLVIKIPETIEYLEEDLIMKCCYPDIKEQLLQYIEVLQSQLKEGIISVN